jgi:hypothetical protein
MHILMCISTPGTKWLLLAQQQPVGNPMEGRFKSCVVQAEAYLLACMHYIELAGRVRRNSGRRGQAPGNGEQAQPKPAEKRDFGF